MKRILAAVLCSVMILAGCGSSSSAPAEETAGIYTPGTYTSTASGNNGDVTLKVTFSADKIESIEVESAETPTIGVPAMDEFTEQVLADQTVPADVKTGATNSSNAYITALKDCITQAGGDPDSMTGDASASEEGASYKTEADIIVIGGGAAGMSAAISASDAGKSVILLEKSGILGGNTVCAANGINGADSQVQLDNETYQEKGASVEGLKSLQMNNPDALENLVDAFAENSGETLDWLSSIGAAFEVDIQEDDRNSEQNYYMVKDTTDGTTAVTLINLVSKELKNKDVEVILNMDATELITDGDVVTGVKAIDASGNTVEFTGKCVLIATGGFGQNSELVGKVNPSLANAVTDEIAPTTGEGLLMAEAVGADTANLDAIQTFPHVVPGYGMILPFNLPGGFTPDALYVNNSAERFTAEGFEIPDVLLSQDKGEVYCIFDDSGMNDGLKTLVGNGVITTADSPEELGEALGIDGAKLAETIDAFNEDIKDGTDDAFGRAENLNEISGTLYGYRFGVGAHYFMGGILIDEDTHVVNTEGNPIEGLYAAGEVTGGFHGTFRVDGSGLGDSFTFGRLAGKKMAEALN
ncbi:MAG: FAD-dependent oxidoreductase [Solobacterium sp.]|nr:FAD-dependent oxidoreductase [Solobacterium sp.]